MAKNQDYAAQLGSAWALHRKGQNEAAITEFNALLSTSANNIDALYGLGLAQRNNHQIESAQASFQRCLDQISAALVEHPREDRYQMLQRITRQRLDELKDSK